jgi:hypothetical protein
MVINVRVIQGFPQMTLSNAPSDSTPLRILIVEDDPVMQLGLEQFFDSCAEFAQHQA